MAWFYGEHLPRYNNPLKMASVDEAETFGSEKIRPRPNSPAFNNIVKSPFYRKRKSGVHNAPTAVDTETGTLLPSPEAVSLRIFLLTASN